MDSKQAFKTEQCGNHERALNVGQAGRAGFASEHGRLFTLDLLDFHEGPGGFPHIEADLTVAAYVYGPLPTVATPVSAPAATTTAPTTTTTTPTP